MVVASAWLVVIAQTPAPLPTQPEVRSEQGQTAGAERKGGRHGQRGDRMAKIDADRDGKISRTEWPRKAEVFAKLDADNDGFLTREEMSAGRKHHGQRGQRGFAKMDQNSDGQVTREEWKGPAEMFDRLDANKDGTVKTDELKGRHHKRHPDGR